MQAATKKWPPSLHNNNNAEKQTDGQTDRPTNGKPTDIQPTSIYIYTLTEKERVECTTQYIDKAKNIFQTMFFSLLLRDGGRGGAVVVKY